MKKFSLIVSILFVILFPLKAFAAVDVEILDKSTTVKQSASVNVSTGSDSLEKIVIPINYSSDLEVTEVNTGTINCSSFEYSNENSVLKITCSLTPASAVDGVLANILFTSNTSNYSFTVIEEDLVLGELEVGEITNIVEIEEEVEEEEEDSEDLLVTTNTLSTEKDDSRSFLDMENLTEYLPYILIAGSVVLLISIIGIILSRKKDSQEVVDATQNESTLEEMVSTPQEQVSSEITPMMNQTLDTPISSPMMQSNPSETEDLKDILQSETQVPSDFSPTPTPSMETTIPEVSPIKNENMVTTETPMQDNAAFPPITTPPMETAIPEVPPMQNENMVATEAPIQQPTGFSPITSESPVAQPDLVIPEINTSSPQDIGQLQNQINGEIQQMQTSTPVTNQPFPPVQDNTTAEDLPPVPPTM